VNPAPRAAERRAAVGCALALVVAGCGGPSFERAPRSAVDLGGHWMLEPTASDDALAIIRASIPKPRPRPADASTMPISDPGPVDPRRGGRGGGGGGGNVTAQQAATPPAWGRNSAGDFLRAFAMPATRLDVVEQPDLVTFAQAERRRSFTPGDDEPLSFTDRFGSRTVRAGWDGQAFVVQSSDGSRLHVLERYERVANDRLRYSLELSVQGLRTMKIHSIYRRATEAELAAPPPDGPPAPGPR